MNTQNTLPAPFIEPSSLTKNILIGAGIALLAILVFVLPALLHPDASWPKLWMIRPLTVTPLAGAFAGACFYIVTRLGYQGGWRKLTLIALGVIGYLITLWLGIVLGLDGTMWN